MDIETINKYIELDNQIKNRIVQISNALRGVRDTSIRKFVSTKHISDLDRVKYTDDFLLNSNCDDFINLACFDDDLCIQELNFDKELLCVDDETLVKIKDYDAAKTQEELEKARERAKLRQEKLKKDVEQQEYAQYLRLKEKFEKKEVTK